MREKLHSPSHEEVHSSRFVFRETTSGRAVWSIRPDWRYDQIGDFFVYGEDIPKRTLVEKWWDTKCLENTNSPGAGAKSCGDIYLGV